MDQNGSQMSFKSKEKQRSNSAREKGPPLRYSDLLAQKLAIRTQLDLQKRRGHVGFADTILDLLRDPVSLGMKGGFRGSKR